MANSSKKEAAQGELSVRVFWWRRAGDLKHRQVQKPTGGLLSLSIMYGFVISKVAVNVAYKIFQICVATLPAIKN